MSGNNNHGTVTGALLANDRFGNANSAYTFNGINAEINLGKIPALQLNSGESISISAWINFENNNAAQNIISYGANSYSFYLQRSSSANFLDWSKTNVIAANEQSAVVSPVSWHHLVGVNTIGSDIKMYLDGNLVVNQSFTSTYTYLNDLFIGRAAVGAGADYFKGLIDDIKIYNRALSQLEITALYNEPAPCTVTSAPIASYPFCGNANDVSGNSINGTIAGIVTLTTDRFNNSNSSYFFNGTSSDYIKVDNSNSLIPKDFFSISFWIRRSRINAKEVLFLSNNSSGWGLFISNLAEGYNNIIRFTKVDVSAVNSSFTIADLNWHHVAITYNNSQVEFYLDGVKYNTAPYSPNFSASQFYSFGERFDNITNPFKGNLDDFKIYNKVLSQSEITTLYNEPAPCTVTSAPIASYPFCGNANDVATNQLNGTIIGSVLLQPDRFNIAASSYKFGGTSTDVIKVQNKSDLLTLKQFSISFWIKRSRIDVKEDLFLAITAGGWGVYISNTAEGNNNKLGFGKIDVDAVFSTYLLNDINWHHSAVVYNGLQATFYLDGVKYNTQSYNSSFTGSDFYSFGDRYGSYSDPFNGQLDDFKVYNKLLSDAEILTLYNEPAPCTVTSAPIASYPFCGNANDVSGNNNHGTVSGATLTTDRFGNANSAYSFLGTSFIQTNYIGIGESNPRTISLWIKPDISKIDQSVLFWYGRGGLDAGGNAAFINQQFTGRINYSSQSEMVVDINNSAVGYLNNSINLYDGLWHHLIYKVEEISNASLNSVKLYVDGILQNQKTTDINTSSVIDTKLFPLSSAYKFTIGYQFYSNIYNYKGLIDDIKIYNRALSQTEITALYNEPAPCTVTSAPIASYPFCGNAKDVSGNGWNAVPVGTTSYATDRFGNGNSSVLFSGANSLDIPNSKNWNLSNGHSFSFWIKPSNPNASLVTSGIISNWESGSFPLAVDLFNDNRIYYIYNGGGAETLISNSILQGSQWYHIVTSWDNFQIKIFINGILDNSKAISNPLLPFINDFSFGLRKNISTSYLTNAILDDIKIYNRALSQLEITALYNEPAPICCDNPVSITGLQTNCFNQKSQFSTIPTSVSGAVWSVTGGAFILRPSGGVEVSWTNVGVNQVILSNTACGDVSKSVTVSCCGITSPTIIGNNLACLKDNATIYEITGANGYNFNWSVLGGIFSKISPNAISVIWTSTGSKSVFATNSICGISLSLPVSVSCCSVLGIEILGNLTPCVDKTEFYAASNSSLSDIYNWTVVGGTYFLNAQNSISVIWNTSGNKKIYVTESVCNASAQADVYVSECKTLTGTTLDFCVPSTYLYSFGKSTANYLWTIVGGNIDQDLGNAVNVNWTSTGNNFIIYKELNSSKTDTLFVYPNLNTLPSVNLGADIESICDDVELKLPNVFLGNILWSTGEKTPSITVKNTGIYSVLISDNCYISADSIKVKITAISEIIPNIITPNGDGKNDFFTVKGCFFEGQKINFTVYNRWGTKVYETAEFKEDWYAEGLPDGIYFFSFINENTKVERKGYIQVIR